MANRTINNPNELSANLGIKPGSTASGATTQDARIYKTGRIVLGYLNISNIVATSTTESLMCEMLPKASPITTQRFLAFGLYSGDNLGYVIFYPNGEVKFYPKSGITGNASVCVTFCYPSAI